MKDIYIEKKTLVINEEQFIPFYNNRLRYVEDKGSIYDSIQEVSVDDIRNLIMCCKIRSSGIKKSVLKKEEIFCLQEEVGPVKIPSKKIQKAYIGTIYTKKNHLSLDELRKELSPKEFFEYCKDNGIAVRSD